MRFIQSLAGLSLATIIGCSTPISSLSPKMGCEYPPETAEGFVRVFCQEFPEDGTFGCGYAGYNNGEMCMVILESTGCQDWHVLGKPVCGVEVLVIPPGMKIPLPEAPPNASNNFQERL